ncbi:MAG: hypothetical protein RI945_332 [Candidatus Parcubacteria bacterium]|jgi:hypothetical protein
MIKTGKIPQNCVRIHNLWNAYGSNYVEETMTSHSLDIEKSGDFLKLEEILEQQGKKKDTSSEKANLVILKRKKKKKTHFCF